MYVHEVIIFLGDGKYAEVLFRTLPLTIIELMNCIIFVKTVKYYLKVKNEVQRLNESVSNSKRKTKFQAKRERYDNNVFYNAQSEGSGVLTNPPILLLFPSGILKWVNNGIVCEKLNQTARENWTNSIDV